MDSQGPAWREGQVHGKERSTTKQEEGRDCKDSRRLLPTLESENRGAQRQEPPETLC